MAAVARHLVSGGPASSGVGVAASANRGLISRVVLAVATAGAVCVALGAALVLAVGHPEGVDTGVFLVAFGLLLPIALAVVVQGGPLAHVGPEDVSFVAVAAATGLVLVLVATKVSDQVAGSQVSSSIVALSTSTVWLAAVAILAVRTRRGMKLPTLAVGSGWQAALLSLVLAALLIALFGWDWISLDTTLLIALVVGVLLFLADRALRSSGLIGNRAAIAVDIIMVVAILLVASDVVVLTFDAEWHRLQEHHDSFLGPVNDVLGGRTLLVDTYPIYGVGSTYFLAAVFHIVPIGYGTFGLLVAAALAALYAIGYATLRLAGCSQVLAATFIAAAIATSIFATMATPTAWPSVGAFRWGFEYLLVLLAVVGIKRGWSPSVFRIAGALIVGVSSIWSFEVFFYAGATYLAVIIYLFATSLLGGGWARGLVRELAPVAVACLLAHLVLASWTLLQAGQLPNWGPYFSILREYSVGGHDRIIAPPWWLGIPFGAILFGSAVGVGAILARAPRFETANRVALVAIAGMTAFGIASFTHLVRFSSSDFVARSDLAVLMVLALWIHLASRSRLARPAGTAIAATGFTLSALLIVLSWPYFEREVPRTPLIASIPGNDSPQGVTSLLWASTEGSSSLDRAWSNPPIQPRSAATEALLTRYWPDQEEALVVLFPDLTVEALMRTGRINLLPISSPLADDLVAEESWKRVEPAIDHIEPGTLMLTERFYLEPGATREYLVGGPHPLELEQMIMDRIRQRFHLEPIATEEVGFDPVMGDDELVVVRLEERD